MLAGRICILWLAKDYRLGLQNVWMPFPTICLISRKYTRNILCVIFYCM